MLEPQVIRSRLKKRSLGDSVAISCIRQDGRLKMHLIGENDELSSFPFSADSGPRELRELGERLATTLCENRDSQLVILGCDPEAGADTKQTLRNDPHGAITAARSCLELICRNGTIRALLNNRPDRLVIAIIKNDMIKTQTQQGKLMVTEVLSHGTWRGPR